MSTTVVPFERQQLIQPAMPNNIVPIGSVKTTLPEPAHFSCVADIRKHLAMLSPQSRWEVATESQRATANKRYHLLNQILGIVKSGEASSESLAIGLFMSACGAKTLPKTVLNIAAELAQKGKPCPGRSTFYGWLEAFRLRGLPGLIPEHTGRVRQHQDWHIPALTLYHHPSKKGFSTVAMMLQQQGYAVEATDVNRLIKAMPAQYGPQSPWRMGKKFFAQNIGPYKSMDNDAYTVGQRYEADGHTVDVWIAHPNHGGIWRPELTIWIDVRSNYVVGWHLSKVESTETTLYALANALVTQNHIPDHVHVDNGSGFVSQIMLDYYARFGIEVSRAIPGNSKGKGRIEGWFKKFRENCDKTFRNGDFYCGDDMSPDALFHLQRDLRRGDIKLPSYEEYRDFIAWFIDYDRNRPQRRLGGKSPAEVWATLQREPLELPTAAIVRPHETRTVRRCRIEFYGREYEHPLLIQFHGQVVRVEYEFNDDTRVWACDSKGRLICEVPLITKKVDKRASISEDRQAEREKNRIARKQKAIDLIRQEERNAIDHTHQLEALEDMGADAWEEIDEPRSGISIDLTDDDF